MSAPCLAYVVVDLETTGLDEHADEIIEVAAVGLSADLETELFRISEPVAWTARGRERFYSSEYAETLIDMHTRSGLLHALSRPGVKSLAEVEQIVLDAIAEHGNPHDKPTLAGSGVSHFDDRFLPVHTPGLWNALFYAPTDVGGFRRFYLKQTGTLLTEVNDAKTHRALDDVECHIEELKAFRDVFLAHAARTRG